MMSLKNLLEEEDKLVEKYNTSRRKMRKEEEINLKARIRLTRERISDYLDPDKKYGIK